jgi:ABC-type nitrate/sulfonate/bicarbonate transport system permease component
MRGLYQDGMPVEKGKLADAAGYTSPGTLILLANNELDTAQNFAVLIILGLLGLTLTLYTTVRAVQKRVLRWPPLEAAPLT